MPTFGGIPWTDHDRFRDLLARAWIYAAEVDWESFPERELLGDLLPLLGPMTALELYGPPGALREHREAVLAAVAAVPTPPHATPSGEYRKKESRPTLALASRLGMVAERLQRAEEEVRDAGWAWDPEARRWRYAEAMNRPREWQNKLACAVYSARYPDLPSPVEKIRDEVARILRWWFPEDLVEPAAGGTLDNALRNYRKKRKVRRR